MSNFILNNQFSEKKAKLENVLEGLEGTHKHFMYEENQLEELIWIITLYYINV